MLGDILGVGYLIDPRVQGTITLASGRPVPKSDLLFVLESALRLSGASLVRDKRGYVILPAAEAVGTGGVDTVARGEPGFGVTVIPLQYVSATTLTKLLDSFAVKPGSVRVDSSRNLVLIQGSGPDRRRMLASALKAPRGRCRTTSTVAARSGGRWATIVRRASTPPAEAPTTTRSRPRPGSELVMRNQTMLCGVGSVALR